MRRRRKHGKILVFLLLAVIALAVLTKPSAVEQRPSALFETMNATLKAHGPLSPRAVIELDGLNANIDRVRGRLGDHHALRIVTKSLPSFELLRHISERARTRRFMEFHGPFLPLLLEAFPQDDTDVLFGKPVPVSTFEPALKKARPALQARFFKNVQWLVDSPETLREYLAFARRSGGLRGGHPLRVNFEIDVGLHRGGFPTPEAMAAALRELKAAGSLARFSGFMGYDGHLTYVPSFLGFGSKMRAIKSQHRKLVARYAAFIEAARQEAPELFAPDAAPLTFNGGGSRTYVLYGPEEKALNDIALGSAFLQPADFDDVTLTDHEPALFVAAPVLKKIRHAGIPFLGVWASKLWALWDPNREWGFFIYGGGWADEAFYPRGLSTNPLYAQFPNRNFLPNQGLMNGSSQVPLSVGDFMFFRPVESDNLFDFEEVTVTQGGRRPQIWRPFSRRF